LYAAISRKLRITAKPKLLTLIAVKSLMKPPPLLIWKKDLSRIISRTVVCQIVILLTFLPRGAGCGFEIGVLFVIFVLSAVLLKVYLRVKGAI
jgi:hypothetical protein